MSRENNIDSATNKVNRIVNLRLIQDGFWGEILDNPRYAEIVRKAFINGDEIIERSHVYKFEEELKIQLGNFNSTVIGSFEVWKSEGARASHRTAYITRLDLPNGEHLYPIISKEDLRRGGVDPSLLVVTKYD